MKCSGTEKQNTLKKLQLDLQSYSYIEREREGEKSLVQQVILFPNVTMLVPYSPSSSSCTTPFPKQQVLQTLSPDLSFILVQQ